VHNTPIDFVSKKDRLSPALFIVVHIKQHEAEFIGELNALLLTRRRLKSSDKLTATQIGLLKTLPSLNTSSELVSVLGRVIRCVAPQTDPASNDVGNITQAQGVALGTVLITEETSAILHPAFCGAV